MNIYNANDIFVYILNIFVLFILLGLSLILNFIKNITLMFWSIFIIYIQYMFLYKNYFYNYYCQLN